MGEARNKLGMYTTNKETKNVGLFLRSIEQRGCRQTSYYVNMVTTARENDGNRVELRTPSE